ncbi:MAG: hypothetical protein K8T20_09290, partial [Planctomycetes bacterium]|nr:hypothetical protein [Planctomycetota bacterium]
WLNPNNVRLMSGGTWYNNQTANWGFNYQWNGTVHVKLEIDGGKVTVYIGEKKVGESNVGTSSGRVGLFSWNAGTSFDNLVITR